MNELFGVSMTLIMFVLVVILCIGLASVAIIALRNPIMFKLGVRNIPRRRAQTVLIVLGLMLSTVIISAAFTTGDTVDRSVTAQVYQILGSVDETIVAGEREDDAALGDELDPTVREQTFDASTVAGVVESLRQNSDIDAVIPVYGDTAVAVNTAQSLSAPLFNLQGLDPTDMAGLPDLRTLDGDEVNVADLGEGEIYVNRSAAEELNVEAGDTITLFTGGQTTGTDFQVREIIEDTRLGGSATISTQREGGAVPLEVAQSFFGAEGKLTMVAVSNEGGARGGVGLSDRVEAEMRSLVPDDSGLTVQATKKLSVDFAEEAGNVFTTFFLAFGLFSIGAGVLLIFMIFVMLAAERKSEMGMARAVGTRRMDLVQTFLSEGMAYNVLAAMVGTAIGVGVAVVISEIMASAFASSNLDISPHVTVRSLVVSYSLGVVLTFLTVTFSSWRVSMINIVRAIRDIPDPPQQPPQWGSKGVLVTLRDLVFKPTDRAGWLRRGAGTIAAVLGAIPPTLPIGALIFVGVLFSYAWSQKAMPVLFRIGAFLGTLIVFPISVIAAIFMTFQLGPMFLGLGLAMVGTFVATDSESAFLLLFGLSLAPLGLTFILRSFGANERLVYTLMAVYLIYIWEFDTWASSSWEFDFWSTGTGFGIIPAIFGEATGDIEMFFVSGVMVTLAATFLVVYNADLILGPLTRFGKGFGALLPSMKMAVAYPLANKSRTGMTMAMFCLVVFALIVMSSMSHNFNRLFLSDRALGGWDILVEENPTNPIGDLKGDLEAANAPVAQEIGAVGRLDLATENRSAVCQVRSDQQCDPSGQLRGDDSQYAEYDTEGMDPTFIESNSVAMQARATGYNSDAEVWEAIASDPSLAVVDSAALAGGGGFGTETWIEGVDALDTTFAPIEASVVDANTGQNATVTVIGIIESGGSATFTGLHVSDSLFEEVFGQPDARRFYAQTVEGTDNVEAANGIESALLTTGAQAVSLKKEQEDQSELFNSFFYLIQGFMGLGLVVGVAAVGVIAFRTVVERRQQIGMLRAIGYTRGMIGLTFLIESAFIAFVGVLSGVVFALILARQLITEQFANQGVTTFSIPWDQVLLISGLAFVAALLMTLIPSRQAASIPIAQALRYE